MPGTVTVLCKLPMGLHLRLHAWEETNELVMGGGTRKGKVARPTGHEVILNGTSARHGQARLDAAGNFVLMVDGYAATPNVDKDFWDKWLDQNKEHDAALRSGLEPLTPTLTDAAGRVIQSDPRASKSITRFDGAKEA
jgi:hypothetical protein